MDFTTRLGLNKPNPDPVTGDYVDVEKLNENSDRIDGAISFTVCTSTGRPAVPFQGQAILETDTGKTWVWGGSAWLPLLVGNLEAQLSKLGIGIAPPTSSNRLVHTYGAGTGGVSQVLLRTSADASGNRALSVMGGTDTQDRWWLDFDGKMQWAAAGASGDVVLYRSEANVLQTEDLFRSRRGASTDSAFSADVSGDDNPRFLVKNGGELTWGDGTAASDTTLYRSGAGILRTGTFELRPTAGASSKHLDFNQGYSLFVDNVGVGGSANSRLWIDTPDGGDVVIGPRASANLIGQLRLRTDATVASAANLFIDSSSYQVKRSTSSIKYKVNVEDIDWDQQLLFQLRPVRFQDKSEYANQGSSAKHYVGLIAEEVHELGLSEFVHYDAEGRPDGVQYDRLTIALLSVVKNLVARVDALERRE